MLNSHSLEQKTRVSVDSMVKAVNTGVLSAFFGSRDFWQKRAPLLWLGCLPLIEHFCKP
jgi:hypothetical protein